MKRGLKVLSLCLAAMGLMAFMASAAQAQESRILGVKVVGSETVEAKQVGEGLLLVPSQNLIIHCTTVTGTDVKLLLTDIDAIILFTGCTTLQNGKTAAGCKPVEPIHADALILYVLHPAGRTMLLAEALTGQPFTILKFSEETCALPPENPVTGSVLAECLLAAGGVGGDCDEEKVVQKIAPVATALAEELGDKLFFGKSPAFLDGEIEAALSGGSKGCKFGGII